MQILFAAAMGLLIIWVVWGIQVWYDRRLMLSEYGNRVDRCPACGRACFFVRRRPTTAKPWGPWRSECCEAEHI